MQLNTVFSLKVIVGVLFVSIFYLLQSTAVYGATMLPANIQDDCSATIYFPYDTTTENAYYGDDWLILSGTTTATSSFVYVQTSATTKTQYEFFYGTSWLSTTSNPAIFTRADLSYKEIHGTYLPAGWYTYFYNFDSDHSFDSYFYVEVLGDSSCNSLNTATTTDIQYGCTGENCSYIQFNYPEQDQIFTSGPISLTMEYYINSNALVSGDKNNVKIIGQWNSVKRSPSAEDVASTTLWGNFEDTSITLLDEVYYSYYDIESVSATGTIQLSASLVETYTMIATSTCWLFFTCEDEVTRSNQIAYGTREIGIGSLTDYYEWATLQQQNEQIAQQNLDAYEATFDFCFIGLDSAKECLASYTSEMVGTILATPPYGYITRLVTILSATSTPTNDSILTLSFPTSSPAFGQVLSLDLNNTVSSSIASLNNDYDGFPNAYDKFMEIWNIVWYGGLGIWILTQIIGTLGLDMAFSFDRTNSNAVSSSESNGAPAQKRGSVPVRSRGTFNVARGQRNRSHTLSLDKKNRYGHVKRSSHNGVNDTLNLSKKTNTKRY